MVLCVYPVVPTVRFDCGILGSSGPYKHTPIFIALRNITMYSAILVSCWILSTPFLGSVSVGHCNRSILEKFICREER